MPSTQSIERPNEAELEWIEANLRGSCSFANTYSTADSEGHVPTLKRLDLAWTEWLREWLSQSDNDRVDPNPILTAVGLAFGQHLADAVRLQWAVVTDEYGTEMAVHGDPGDIVVFPANLVAKRFAKRETGFLAALFEKMCADIRAIQK